LPLLRWPTSKTGMAPLRTRAWRSCCARRSAPGGMVRPGAARWSWKYFSAAAGSLRRTGGAGDNDRTSCCPALNPGEATASAVSGRSRQQARKIRRTNLSDILASMRRMWRVRVACAGGVLGALLRYREGRLGCPARRDDHLLPGEDGRLVRQV